MSTLIGRQGMPFGQHCAPVRPNITPITTGLSVLLIAGEEQQSASHFLTVISYTFYTFIGSFSGRLCHPLSANLVSAHIELPCRNVFITPWHIVVCMCHRRPSKHCGHSFALLGQFYPFYNWLSPATRQTSIYNGLSIA